MTTLLSAVLGSWLFVSPAISADWPMWRYDATRGGASPEELPEELHLQWTLELPTPQPAWPANQDKLQFDRLYEPVLSGKTLFVPSMISDKLTAYDSGTGKEKWVFYADGPVRLAPLAWRDKVYFNCDDGFVYCLRVADGTLVWKFRGGPTDRQVLGQDRLISTWPARGAAVIRDDILYFGAGIWPFEGIFLYAVNPETGDVLWRNTGSGSEYLVQPHGSPAFAGVAPQGYIAATKDRLVVSGGRTMPAVYDRHTGKFIHFNLSAGGGGYEVAAGETFYLNRDKMYRLDDGKFIATVGAPVVTEHTMIGADKGALVGYKPSWRQKEVPNRRGELTQQTVVDTSWSATLEQSIGKVFIQSGSRLYGVGKKNTVLAVDLPMLGRGARVSWQVNLPDEPLNMLTGDGKLFVTTDQGRIYAFGAAPTEAQVKPVQVVKLRRTQLRFPRDHWTRLCREILRETQANSGMDKGGYALALGLGSGRLVEELVSQSDYQVIVIEEDAEKVETFRRRMDALGVYGTRVAVRVANPRTLDLPPYFATLVVAEDLAAVGGGEGTRFVRRVFDRLRPFSGVACFSVSRVEGQAWLATVQEAELDGGDSELAGDFALLKRTRAPTGAANWTHQYGDASNCAVSADTRVKAPLGLLWFGGPSNEEVLPRHGHGPTPQVVDGRVIIQGRHMLRATDAYTGRLLWQRDLPDVGIFYDYTTHEPGANLIGSNYVSLPDGIYVVHGKTCLRLDPATSETLSEFSLPRHAGEDETPGWGYIGVWKDVLVAGARPSEYTPAGYTEHFIRRFFYGEARANALAAILGLKSFISVPRKRASNNESLEDWEFLLQNANKLLADPKMVARIPAELRTQSGTADVEKRLEEYLSGDGARKPDDEAALRIKREILHLCFGLPKYVAAAPGTRMSLQRSGSQKLVGMDRKSGRVLWEFESRHILRHNAIALGGGKVFAIDRLSDWQIDYYKRRGKEFEDRRRLVALDIHSGAPVWEIAEGIFGTWLGYSAKHDILLEAGSKAGDRSRDEVGQGMNAYAGKDGKLAWSNDREYSGPCLLLGDRVITQGYSTPGFALEIPTGKDYTRRHPISGEDVPWQYTRNYGCNTAIGCPNLLTFRSAAAGYYDLLGESGTGNFGGFRAGCTTNLIPASGVLNAPDYTRTCTCSYQNQASLGLVHLPEADMWTFNRYPYDNKPVERIGINLGAPGDRLGDDGTLWLDYPSVGGESPDLPTVVFGEAMEYPRVHPSGIESNPLSWVGASALRGAIDVVLQIAPRPVSSIANEFPDRPELRIDNGQLLRSVAAQTVPRTGKANRMCLSKQKNEKKLRAVVPHHDALHVDDVTVEYWVRDDGHANHIDARGRDSDGEPLEQGFVVDTIDGGKLRVRYFVAGGEGEENGKPRVLATDAELSSGVWAHVAFTYAMESGTASLWVDGELVGMKDGEDKRGLWWEGRPGWRIGTAASGQFSLDELRVLNKVLSAEDFLLAAGADKSEAIVRQSTVGYWRMEAPTSGADLSTRSYNVRLVFAELERLGPGERVFDVSLQGRVVLEDFDIVKETGAPYRILVKEFSGIQVAESLEIHLEPQGRTQPLLAGIQLLIEREQPATSD